MTDRAVEGGEEAPTARAIRVFLLDDHEIVRRGVRRLIETEDDLRVVGEAASAAEAIALIPGTQPDVALIDVQLGDGTGIEVCRTVRSVHPEIRCVMLTSFADEEVMRAAVRAGAVGYVLKQIRGRELVDTLRMAGSGRPLEDPTSTVRAAQRLAEGPGDPLLAELTTQELRILGCLAAGLSNRQIAERLQLGEKTVKNYVSTLLMKMGMRSRTEAAVYVFRHGAAPSSR
jgi:two-component system, NarL family, response regulator DevR